MDSLTDFERRVASWESDAKETLSDLINIQYSSEHAPKNLHVTVRTPRTSTQGSDRLLRFVVVTF